MPGSAKQNQVWVSDFDVRVNGTKVPLNTATGISRITVDEELNLPTMFQIDFTNRSWNEMDLEKFKVGAKVDIKMGVMEVKSLVSGEIMAVETIFDEFPRVSVRGYDALYELQVGRKTQSFSNKSDSDMVGKLARDRRMKTKISTTKDKYTFVLQKDQTDYEFIMERARRNNFIIFFRDNVFYFQASGEAKKPKDTFDYGIGLKSFSGRMKTLKEGSEVMVRGWDAVKKEAIEATATRAEPSAKMGGKQTGFQTSVRAVGKSPVIVIDEEVESVKAAKELAQSYYDELLNDFISGEGALNGDPDIQSDTTLKLQGLGDLFDGIYYLTSTTHVFDYDQGYTTSFRARRTGA